MTQKKAHESDKQNKHRQETHSKFGEYEHRTKERGCLKVIECAHTQPYMRYTYTHTAYFRLLFSFYLHNDTVFYRYGDKSCVYLLFGLYNRTQQHYVQCFVWKIFFEQKSEPIAIKEIRRKRNDLL